MPEINVGQSPPPEELPPELDDELLELEELDDELEELDEEELLEDELLLDEELDELEELLELEPPTPFCTLMVTGLLVLQPSALHSETTS